MPPLVVKLRLKEWIYLYCVAFSSFKLFLNFCYKLISCRCCSLLLSSISSCVFLSNKSLSLECLVLRFVTAFYVLLMHYYFQAFSSASYTCLILCCIKWAWVKLSIKMFTLFVWTYDVPFALGLVTGMFISFCWE